MQRNINFKDFDYLVESTSKYMKENNLCDLFGSYGKNSHFYSIIRQYFSFLNREKASFNLYVKWNRNDNMFRTKVLENIKLVSSQNSEQIVSIKSHQQIRMVFNHLEWGSILKYTTKNERPLLLVGSNQIFTKKFFICGIKCSLKLKFNRFRTTKRDLPGHNYWYGEFKCTICKKSVKSLIEKEPNHLDDVIMMMNFENTCSGLAGKIRIDGETRESIKQEVYSKGTICFKIDATQNSN